MTDQQSLEEFRALVVKTNRKKPAEADVEALRSYLEEHPELCRAVGDLAWEAALRLIGGLGGPPVWRESLQQGWHAMKEELGYKDAPALERLLIEQVVLCWLRHNLLEVESSSVESRGSMMVLQVDARHNWLAASQRRYLRACETLARVRKLVRSTPALQVNIAAYGGQQVNIQGAPEGGAECSPMAVEAEGARPTRSPFRGKHRVEPDPVERENPS